ncbi:GNAT family N-acetyltransferase [Sandaracinobacter sp. RS1-74]|uniref:GNAT family N-acetyltransferase n=1 Tax=Sandaracinobacteroides sayramensis TaxID=2913411 RepID=UPI001EDC027E|nr:GNAT family N-acetyltransferase [Sandaracinobacteroides sayramensis]MCG2842580.1 GNAT family N-acetyltransferase [Sandaracinobacteroides sayramensis]
MNPVIRPMAQSDLEAAWALSRSFDWPHRLEDWRLFLDLGQGLAMEVDGRVQGTVMAFDHGAALSTLGMMIVAKAQQGKGFGRKLVEAMLARLEGRSVVLQATEAGASLYTRLGFRDAGRILQHQGVAPMIEPPLLPSGYRIARIDASDRAAVDLYSRASGADRSRLMAGLFATARCAMLYRDGEPSGFSMMREFGRGWCIGPVVAPDREAAMALIQYWVAANAGRFTRVDLTGDEALSRWLEGLGLPLRDGARTMVRGRLPLATGDITVFALTAHALG